MSRAASSFCRFFPPLSVAKVRQSAFYRTRPDPEAPPAEFYTHVASPEIFVDRIAGATLEID
ncbi:MAG: hypothetical protein ABL963_02360 [Longimicrobiales bacterium]